MVADEDLEPTDLQVAVKRVCENLKVVSLYKHHDPKEGVSF